MQHHDIDNYNREHEIDDIEDPSRLKIRGDNQELLDSIFGIDEDDDDDNVIAHELEVAKEPIISSNHF